jgi:hypothetical protein
MRSGTERIVGSHVPDVAAGGAFPTAHLIEQPLLLRNVLLLDLLQSKTKLCATMYHAVNGAECSAASNPDSEPMRAMCPDITEAAPATCAANGYRPAD